MRPGGRPPRQFSETLPECPVLEISNQRISVGCDSPSGMPFLIRTRSDDPRQLFAVCSAQPPALCNVIQHARQQFEQNVNLGGHAAP